MIVMIETRRKNKNRNLKIYKEYHIKVGAEIYLNSKIELVGGKMFENAKSWMKTKIITYLSA